MLNFRQTQSSCGFNIYGQKPLYINGVFYWYDEYSSSRFIRRMSSLYGKSCPHLASPDRYPDIAFDYNGHAYNDVDLNFDETGKCAAFKVLGSPTPAHLSKQPNTDTHISVYF